MQPAGIVAVLVDAGSLDQGHFPSRRLLVRRPLLPRLPRIIPTGRHPKHLAEPPHGAEPTFGVDETAAAHRVSVCEMTRLKRLLARALFKMASSCACPQARARSWRRSWAAVFGSSAAPQCGRNWRLGSFLPLVEAFRVNVERPPGGLGRAALRGQAQRQSSGAEGHIVRAAIVGFCRVFHDEGEIPLCSVQIN